MERYAVPPFIRESNDHYHAQRPNYLTSHQLIDFIRCPLAYKRAKSGMMGPRWRRDTEALLIGRAGHVLTLEGRERFDNDYLVADGPINPKTDKPYGAETKKFREWSKTLSRPVLTHEQAGLVEELAAAVLRHEEAKKLLAFGTPEGVLRCNYAGIDCQIRVDWFSEVDGLVDLKTCYDLDQFESDAKEYGYGIQMAFYAAIIKWHTRDWFLPSVHLIAVEKQEPYRVGVWPIDPADIERVVNSNLRYIAELRECQATGRWPTRYEQKRTLRIA